MMTAGRRGAPPRVAIGIAVFVVVMHVVAYSMVGRFADAAARQATVWSPITASVLLSWLLMVSQAMESIDARLLCARRSRSHPGLAGRRAASVRRAHRHHRAVDRADGAAAGRPVHQHARLRGGWRWLGAYGVIVAMGAAATALAVAAHRRAVSRSSAPKRTRLIAQIVAAVIGAAFVIGLQVAAILSYGTLSRSRRAAIAGRPRAAPGLDSLVWWPARAALGDGRALAAVLA